MSFCGCLAWTARAAAGIFGSHYAPPVCNTTLAETEANILAKLDAYWDWAQQEPLVSGFCGWHLLNRTVDQNWKPGCDEEVGAVGMPKVMAKLRAMGGAVLHPPHRHRQRRDDTGR
jgi:hypothetical protein